MDYSGYQEFPFPSQMSEEDQRLKSAFLALSDDRQLALLRGCTSYAMFRARANSSLIVL